MIDLAPNIQQEIFSIFRKRVPNSRVFAFGSRVLGTAKKFSDLDLVLLDQQNEAAELESIKDDLSESDIPILVDLHLWSEIPDHFKEEINRTSVIFYDGQSSSFSESGILS